MNYLNAGRQEPELHFSRLISGSRRGASAEGWFAQSPLILCVLPSLTHSVGSWGRTNPFNLIKTYHILSKIRVILGLTCFFSQGKVDTSLGPEQTLPAYFLSTYVVVLAENSI